MEELKTAVFPAYAGMIRPPREKQGPGECVPRLRGDDPACVPIVAV